MLQTLFTAYPRLWLLIVSITAQAIGAFWFGPLFGKTFMKEENWSEEDVKTLPMKPMWVMLLQEFLSRAVFFLGLGLLLQYVGMDHKWEIGLFYFFGVLSYSWTGVIWGKNKTWRSWMMGAGKILVDLIIALLVYGAL